MMTRKEQLEKLRAGESVFVQMKDGVRLVSHESHLPSEEDQAIASGDPVEEDAAKASLRKQIADLEARLAKVETKPRAPEPAKVEPPKTDAKGK